jgi:hypothetical protein
MGNKTGKNWHIKIEDMKELFHWDEGEACLATDRITVDGCKVGYMYRQPPDHAADSGWRFTAGDESEEYMGNLGNSSNYTLNMIANDDPEIIPFLTAPVGSAFYRDDDGVLRRDEGEDDGEDCIANCMTHSIPQN